MIEIRILKKGSAAFNLLIITAVCVVSIEANETKRIKNFKGEFIKKSQIYNLF